MKKNIKGYFAALIILALISCGKNSQESKVLAEKKAALEKLKSKRADLDKQILQLQSEIASIKPDSEVGKSKLVSVMALNAGPFRHYIDLRGHIDAEDISYISPRTGPGQVKALLVKQGQPVSKGQLLLKLDDAIINQQVIASTQQLEGIKTQLAYAKTLYDRQKNLWDQGIGTEVQLINARTNVASLENQLKAAAEQVQVAKEQLRATNIYSDVSGVADVVNVRVGEIFSGMGATGPQIKIVNTHNPKVVINVPENYINRLKKGTEVEIEIIDANKKFKSSISVLSQSIDPVQRGFMAEASLPADPLLRPNQNAVVRILDYSVDSTIIIPINVVQTDEKGKYVFVAESAKGKNTVRKMPIRLGEVYRDSAEVRSGMANGMQLITAGYQDLYEGQTINTKP
jgi:RND family efflux transporter MFP subunit